MNVEKSAEVRTDPDIRASSFGTYGGDLLRSTSYVESTTILYLGNGEIWQQHAPPAETIIGPGDIRMLGRVEDNPDV